MSVRFTIQIVRAAHRGTIYGAVPEANTPGTVLRGPQTIGGRYRRRGRSLNSITTRPDTPGTAEEGLQLRGAHPPRAGRSFQARSLPPTNTPGTVLRGPQLFGAHPPRRGRSYIGRSVEVDTPGTIIRGLSLRGRRYRNRGEIYLPGPQAAPPSTFGLPPLLLVHGGRVVRRGRLFRPPFPPTGLTVGTAFRGLTLRGGQLRRRGMIYRPVNPSIIPPIIATAFRSLMLRGGQIRRRGSIYQPHSQAAVLPVGLPPFRITSRSPLIRRGRSYLPRPSQIGQPSGTIIRGLTLRGGRVVRKGSAILRRGSHANTPGTVHRALSVSITVPRRRGRISQFPVGSSVVPIPDFVLYIDPRKARPLD